MYIYIYIHNISHLVVDGRTYSLSAGLDAHVTIGKWKKTGDTSSWCHYFTKARNRLANTPMLDMVMMPNRVCCDDKHLVFTFAVDSHGGSTLHGASQTLNACGLTQSERPARGMSPPGQVFHLSVYGSPAR
jgi:hypothetical protein